MNFRLTPLIVPFHAELSATGTWPAFVASCTCEIVAVYASPQTGITANTTDYASIEILDGGSTGTGTASVASRGGKSSAWVAATKYTIKAPTATPHQIDTGDQVLVKYTEAGTVAFGHIQVTFHVVPGTAD